MKNKLILTLMQSAIQLFSLIAFSQNVTINYQTWNPSSPPCDVFNTATNVPATINGTNGTIQHVTLIGDAKYSTSDQSVQLDCSYINASDIRGTKYRIAYNFKVGHRYIITVTSAALGSSSAPFLRLDLTNNGSSGGTACLGPQSVTPNLSGNPPAIQYSSTSFQDVQFAFSTPLASVFPILEITSLPAQSTSSNSIRIRKIVIAETAPAPSFMLTPSSQTISCGSSVPLTFTVTGSNIPNGATVSYNWNLGANNGWNYNGSAAPSTIMSGATNTLTLTPVCGTVQNNISVTATVNGTNYNTNSTGISYSQPSLSIIGNSSLCNGSTDYIINGLVCNSSVVWTAPPSNLATLSSLTTSPTTLTYGGSSGNFTLTANVTSCGITTPVTLPVRVGSFTASDYTLTANSSLNQPLLWCPNTTYGFSLSGPASNYLWTVPTGWTSTYNGGYINTMRSPSGSTPPTATIQVAFTEPCGTSLTKTFFAAFSSSACIGTDPRFTYSPNPAPSFLNVAVASGFTSTTRIRRIQIIRNSTATTVFDQSYGTPGVTSAFISTSSFQTGTHTLRIFDGSTWAVYQFVR
jgi:hypothetical protein